MHAQNFRLYDMLQELDTNLALLKSNFDLVDGKFVGCCIAVQNVRKFARVRVVQNVARTSIFLAKLALCTFNLCIYLICIQLPRDI